MKSLELSDWLNSINTSKENLLEEHPDSTSSYTPYIINKCMSAQLDTILFAQEMNQHPYIPKEMQYLFYLHGVRKKKRFSPWLKKVNVENLEAVKEYYGYNNKKAMDALKILNREQINFIKQRLNKGGLKK
jgi:hypothetical protein